MDLGNVFRPSSPLDLTLIAGSVSIQLPAASPPEHKIKPFSAHQLAARAQGAQELPEPCTPGCCETTSQGREETVLVKGKKKTQNNQTFITCFSPRKRLKLIT